MKLTGSRILIASLILGIVITLATGLLFNHQIGGISSCGSNIGCEIASVAYNTYGYPMAWLNVGVGSASQVRMFQPTAFVLDAAFWFIISAVILFAIRRAKTKPRKG